MPHIFADLQIGTFENQKEPEAASQQIGVQVPAGQSNSSDEISQMRDILRQKSSWSVYSYYINAAGWALFTVSQAAMMVECFASSFSSECLLHLKTSEVLF